MASLWPWIHGEDLEHHAVRSPMLLSQGWCLLKSRDVSADTRFRDYLSSINIRQKRGTVIRFSLYHGSLCESGGDARVADGVGAREEAAFAVFEPLGEGLVATDLVEPEVGGDAIEVLSTIDAEAYLEVVSKTERIHAPRPIMRNSLSPPIVQKYSGNS